MIKELKILKYILLLSVMLSAMACESVDSQRIPALNVNIDLSNAGLWNTYGVSGYGMCRIFDREQRIPDNFAYTERTFTGYGGVMLVYGINGPVAYDRACPVEVSRKAVLYFDSSTLEAYCKQCGSRFNVCEADGVPVKGQALENRYGLQRLSVVPAGGGYLITR